MIQKTVKNSLLEYCFIKTAVGEVLIVLVDGGVCELIFANQPEQEILAALMKRWPGFVLKEVSSLKKIWEKKMLDLSSFNKSKDFVLKGTDFQVRVWHELLKIPFGKTRSYEQIAKAIGKPKAVRAVGTAIGKNPVPYLVPCHRVIRKNGDLGGYSGGLGIKKQLLALEKAL